MRRTLNHMRSTHPGVSSKQLRLNLMADSKRRAVSEMKSTKRLLYIAAEQLAKEVEECQTLTRKNAAIYMSIRNKALFG